MKTKTEFDDIDLSQYVKDDLTIWRDSYYQVGRYGDIYLHPLVHKFDEITGHKQPLSKPMFEKALSIAKKYSRMDSEIIWMQMQSTKKHTLVWYHQAFIEETSELDSQLSIQHLIEYIILDKEKELLFKIQEKRFLDYHIDDESLRYVTDVRKTYFEKDKEMYASAPHEIKIVQEDPESVIIGIKYLDRTHFRKHDHKDKSQLTQYVYPYKSFEKMR